MVTRLAKSSWDVFPSAKVVISAFLTRIVRTVPDCTPVLLGVESSRFGVLLAAGAGRALPNVVVPEFLDLWELLPARLLLDGLIGAAFSPAWSGAAARVASSAGC